ncbi:hypothetical protein D4768_21285 [Rhodococcus erythropolis]|uniref:hypothetical protein n=1 Tax=Rhodococcus erythropolis TaxID=1833 RepID=UPI001F46DD98|nr:hypothetical protein [Rhodococcus erythropolis]UJC79930.1 hypothetical protein D4768_21285 [Rhodococcus erythropolis]
MRSDDIVNHHHSYGNHNADNNSDHDADRDIRALRAFSRKQAHDVLFRGAEDTCSDGCANDHHAIEPCIRECHGVLKSAAEGARR